MKQKLCECGCGKPTTRNKNYPHNFNRFIHGHGRNRIGIPHTEETKRKISRAMMGKHWNLSEETKRKMSKAKSKAKFDMSEALKGKTYEERYGIERAVRIRRKLSKALKGRHLSKEQREKRRKPRTEETKRKMSKAALQRWSNPKHKEKMSKLGKERWQNLEWREKQLKAIHAGRAKSSTKPERRLRNGLNKMFPGEYKYIGDGKVWIAGKNPDFINVNGQKKIVELFGNFWHGEKYRLIAFGDNSSNKEHEQQRIKHFAKYGYKTLIVWESELGNIPRLRKKLTKFHTI